MKLFIATPMYGGNAKHAYVTSYSNLITELYSRGHQPITMTLTNESLVTRARNTLANSFMESDCDGMLFIDADHSFDAKGVVDMVEFGKDVIGAVYPMKGINWEVVREAALAGKEDLAAYSGKFAFNFVKGDTQPIDGVAAFEVEHIGTGLLYISRKALETVAPKCKTYYSNEINDPTGKKIRKDIEFFYTHVDEEQYLVSEDFSFCKLWRSVGGSVWAAPWVQITHMGDYNFSGSFQKYVQFRYEQENS